MIGLSIGHASWKTAHFEQARRLLDESKRCGFELRLIVIGPIREYLARHAPATLHTLREDPRIFLIDEYARIDERELAEHVTFYWRAYRDYSVPNALYYAAAVRKPILAYGSGFLSEAVLEYSMGAVIKHDFSNIETALRCIVDWDPSAADAFLETHTWAKGVGRLITALVD